MPSFFARERRTLLEIVKVERTHPLELLGGVSAILRGGWVAWQWDVVHSSPIAEYLETLAPVWLWGVAVLLAGTLQVLALARDDLAMRRAANLILVGLVASILVGYLVRDLSSIAVPLYGTMFLKQLWIGMRITSPVNMSRVFLIPRDGGGPAALHGG
jgi:hypothetical protein